MQIIVSAINPFEAAGLFLYPMKASESRWFSYVFGGVKRDK